MTISGLVINNIFSIRMWVRPEITNGVLLSVTKVDYEFPGNEDHLVYGLNGGTSTRLRYESQGT
jgi:hypothetical protein